MRGMGLVMSVVLVVMAIIPILPPPGRCWGVTLPTPPPGWHGKPPIYLPQIIVCNFPIHGQPVPPTYPPHPIPLNPHSISLIVTAPPQPPGGCNSLYCWVNQ
jgi:hypothetical protein